MNRILSILLAIAVMFSFAACGTAKESVVIPEMEYGALYGKYIASIDIGMIFNSAWDDANYVEPEYFLYYYADSFLRSGGKFELYDDNGMYIPAEELESFVQSHFDVTAEHLRTNECYIAERNAYEFGGLGSTWHCDITGAERKGKLLTIEYDVIGAMDYVVGRGIIGIEINGENYKYLSNEYERTAQYYLDYPNSGGIVDNKGILMMDSGGGITLGNPELNIHEYSGSRLSDIIYYYENEALPELDASGSADMAKYEDGWYWSGTYRGGKPLTIDVQRRYGADTYVITALYTSAANPDVANNMRSRNYMQPPGLNDFSQLSSLYFWRPYYAGVLSDTWDIAENANVQSLVALYALNLDFTGELAETSFPADDVEGYVRRYFDISTDTMRGWNVYDRDKNEYAYTPVDVTTICDIVSATSYGASGEGATKIMIAYEIHRSEDDDTVIWGGELTVELSDNGYKYISNNKYYPQYPITQDTMYLDGLTEKYLKPLMPAYGIAWRSWQTAQEISADSLTDFCSYNNLLNRELGVEGEYLNSHGPAVEVESAIQRYFNVPSEYLRTSGAYNYVSEETGERYDNEYCMFHGYGGGGTTRALHAEQDGNLLRITVGLYGPDDEMPDRPAKTGLLTIRLDGDSYKYLSYEIK